jgi:hypothetical protein
MVLTQETAYSGQTRVVILLKQFMTLYFCVYHHAAKLVDEERLAVSPNPFLLIDSWSAPNLDGQPAKYNQG